MRLLPEELLELVYLRLDAAVGRLPIARQGGRTRVLGQVPRARREDAGLHHLDHRLDLDREHRAVVLEHHLLARVALLGGEYAHGQEDLLGLVGVESRRGLRRRLEVGEATPLGLLRPLRRVAVAREDDAAVLLVDLRDGVAVACAALDKRGELCHARGHDGVDDGNGERTVLGGADGAELEAVAAEGEGRGAVAVLHAAGRALSGGGLRVGELLLRLVAQQGAAGDDRVHVRLETSARVERDDGGRGLLCTQAVVVARGRHGAAHELVVLLQAVRQASDARDEELPRGVGLSGVEEVEASVCADGPVVVLAGAVDAGEGLLVEEDGQAELLRLLRRHLHEENIVVRREGGLAVDGRHLVLRGGDLVVHHGHGHAEPEHRRLDVEEQP
mmetsp:Transcript_6718/g.21657  ORF Transcript_6718/g.21657 Transcript_6718/m.21657 type:complete len:388 (+) Transcript_6718:522-1685(+)